MGMNLGDPSHAHSAPGDEDLFGTEELLHRAGRLPGLDPESPSHLEDRATRDAFEGAFRGRGRLCDSVHHHEKIAGRRLGHAVAGIQEDCIEGSCPMRFTERDRLCGARGRLASAQRPWNAADGSGHVEHDLPGQRRQRAKQDRDRAMPRRFEVRGGQCDSQQALLDAERLDERPGTGPDLVEMRRGLDIQDAQALFEPLEMRAEAERCAAVNADRLEASVPVEEPTVQKRNVSLRLRDEFAVKPRVRRPWSPPRGLG